MQNLKPTVVSALQTATALSTLTFYYFYPTDFNNLPCGSYFELDNTGSLYADNQEIGSEIIFQIDLWGNASLSAYALAVDTAMTGIDFVRISALDQYEKDTHVYHKAMRYKINYSDPTF